MADKFILKWKSVVGDGPDLNITQWGQTPDAVIGGIQDWFWENRDGEQPEVTLEAGDVQPGMWAIVSLHYQERKYLYKLEVFTM